ncbi:MAG: hypothetical protein ACI9VR_004827 [Cognaticolwellia sp.]|jgi:hypothetical protein
MILLLAGLSAAHATSCLIFEDSYNPEIFPRTEAALPPNVRPLVRGYGGEEILLLDSDGAQVPITVSPGPSFDGRSQREVRPDHDLPPGTYSLSVGGSGVLLNISGHADHAAPLGGSLQSVEWFGPMLSQDLMYFGQGRYLMLELEEVVDALPALVEVRWARSPTGPWTLHSFWPRENTFIGHDVCPPSTAQDPTPGVPMYLETRTRDAAGQVSSWSLPTRVVPGRKSALTLESDLALGLGLLVLLIALGAAVVVIQQVKSGAPVRR